MNLLCDIGIMFIVHIFLLKYRSMYQFIRDRGVFTQFVNGMNCLNCGCSKYKSYFVSAFHRLLFSKYRFS